MILWGNEYSHTLKIEVKNCTNTMWYNLTVNIKITNAYTFGPSNTKSGNLSYK